MTGHGALTVKEGPFGDWFLTCECLTVLVGCDALEVHRVHQDHVVAQALATERYVAVS